MKWFKMQLREEDDQRIETLMERYALSSRSAAVRFALVLVADFACVMVPDARVSESEEDDGGSEGKTFGGDRIWPRRDTGVERDGESGAGRGSGRDGEGEASFGAS